MKKFLLLQLRPEDETSDNEFETFLQFGELKENEIERMRIESTGIPKLDLSQYSGIMVGGSPFDISTPGNRKSDIQKKIEADFKTLFDEVVPNDVPFFGACSGNGLLGNYLGATISGKYGEAIGGVDITITDEGKNDPLLDGIPSPFRALVGHKEACDDVPQGAVLLGSSETCPVEMFRVGQNVYATQFHPEADAKAFELRINTYKHHGYFTPPTAADEIIAHIQNETTPHANEILRRFVERYRG